MKVLQSLQIPAEQAVYIADNEEKDFIAPNKLGIWTIQIVRPAGLHKTVGKLSQAAARYKINEISQLPAFIRDIEDAFSRI